MTSARPAPFRPVAQAIGMSRDGRLVRLVPMTASLADAVGPGLAGIDPWARVGYAPERMTGFLAATESGAQRYAVLVADEPAGTVVIRDPWLHGPYLHLIGLLPPFHGLAIGSRALDWMDAEARGRYRNLWLCVSEFNDGARRLYERHGFALAGRLDSLVFDGMTELLMRKRLFG